MKALIVDDSRAIRSMLARLLKARGIETAEAGNGKEALSVLGTAGGFDLGFFDWNMPEMDGFELLKAVRADVANTAMRVMMITTESELPRMSAALEAGANEYLMKPFTPESFFDKLVILGAVESPT
jgi:two-component system chemotaxis response regulator CheY